MKSILLLTTHLLRPATALAQRRAFTSSAPRHARYGFIGLGQMVGPSSVRLPRRGG